MKLLLVSLMSVSAVALADLKPQNAVIGNPCGPVNGHKTIKEACLASPRGPARKQKYLVLVSRDGKSTAIALTQLDEPTPTTQDAYKGMAAFSTEFSRSYLIHHDVLVSVDGGNPNSLRVHFELDNGTNQFNSGWIALERRPETKALQGLRDEAGSEIGPKLLEEKE